MPVMNRDGKGWTRDETILALGLYFQMQYRVRLSSTLKEHLTTATFNDYFKRYENMIIHLPRRARPAVEFLSYHNENVFVA